MAGVIGYVLGLICGVMAVMCWALCAAGKRREEHQRICPGHLPSAGTRKETRKT